MKARLLWVCGVTNVSAHIQDAAACLIGGGTGHTPVQMPMTNASKLSRRKELKRLSQEIVSVQFRAFEETSQLTFTKAVGQHQQIFDWHSMSSMTLMSLTSEGKYFQFQYKNLNF